MYVKLNYFTIGHRKFSVLSGTITKNTTIEFNNSGKRCLIQKRSESQKAPAQAITVKESFSGKVSYSYRFGHFLPFIHFLKNF